MKYIDPPAKVWAHLHKIHGWVNGDRPAPVTVEWDLSNRCVLGCRDCHFAHTHTRGPWTALPRVLPVNQQLGGDLADYVVVLRVLSELHALGTSAVVWTGGGEPTTHPQWRVIVRHAAEERLRQGMYTLGALLTPDDGRLLRDTLDWVVVSLDAHTPELYAEEKQVPASRFQPAVEGIRSLAGGPATLGVSFLLHERNWRLAPDMLKFARTLGPHYVTFRPTIRTQPDDPSVPTGDRAWAVEAQPLLRSLALESDVECSPSRFLEWANWTVHPYADCCGVMLSATITPNGKVWICPNRREQSEACIGDLSVTTFRQIWASHPGKVPVDASRCRAMCKLHPVNQTLAPVFAETPRHADFV